MSNLNQIVWKNGDFYITVDNKTNPSTLTLFNKDRGIGALYTKKVNDFGDSRLSVDSIHVIPEYRNQGLATQMYKVLLDLSDDGILSYLPDRENWDEIPSIYQRLGGQEEDDYAWIDKPKESS